MQSFIGLCTYYRKFVKGFATVARPLHHLTGDKTPFDWTPDCEEAFVRLKTSLTTSPLLAYPSADSPFILDTDASLSGIGGVLSQIQGGVEQVVSYFSRVLSKTERNYCVTRRELLAVVKTVVRFHHYLYGRKFLIRTDHASLRWLLSFRAPEGQVARWIERLGQYDFEIQHRARTLHRNADALFRRPCEPEGCRQCSRLESQRIPAVRIRMISLEESLEEWKEAQRRDTVLNQIMSWRESGARPDWQDVPPASHRSKFTGRNEIQFPCGTGCCIGDGNPPTGRK